MSTAWKGNGKKQKQKTADDWHLVSSVFTFQMTISHYNNDSNNSSSSSSKLPSRFVVYKS